MNRIIASILVMVGVAVVATAQTTSRTTVTETTINGTDTTTPTTVTETTINGGDTTIVKSVTTVVSGPKASMSSAKSSGDPAAIRRAAQDMARSQRAMVEEAAGKMAGIADSMAIIGKEASEVGKMLVEYYVDRISKTVESAKEDKQMRQKMVGEALNQVDNIFTIIEEATKIARTKTDSIAREVDKATR